MATVQPSKRRWLRVGSWSLVLGDVPRGVYGNDGFKAHPVVIKRREHARPLFPRIPVLERIWRWFPGGFGS